MTKHEKLVQESKELYESVGTVMCPALKAKVHFNADGLHHILYTTTRRERPELEQASKLRFLKEAIEIVTISTTYQEYEVRNLRTQVKRKKKTVFENVDVQYWAFIAMVKNRRIKVIVRRAGNGQYNFWSIIPNWDNKKIAGHKVSSTAKGDLEHD